MKEIVQEGVQEIVDTLKEYEEVNERFGDPEVLEDPDKMDALINRQAELQDKIDATDAWNLDSRLERAMELCVVRRRTQVVDTLSGASVAGWPFADCCSSSRTYCCWDEPTNHLDIDSKEVLENALIDFDGTLLFVSHDRYFINQTATRIMDLVNHTFVNYIGNYDYYLEKKEELTAAYSNTSRLENNSSSAAFDLASDSKLSWQEQKEAQAKERKRANEFKKTEERIGVLEDRSAEIDILMSQEEVYTNSVKCQELAKERAEIDTELETLYEKWEELAE